MGKKEEKQYLIADKKFKESHDKIIRAITAYEYALNIEERKKLGITEVDYIRLGRYEEIIKKYTPKRDIESTKGLEKLKQNFRRILNISSRNTNENDVKNEIENFSNSFLIIQENFTDFLELLRCDRVLKNLNQENIDDIQKILEDSSRGKIIDEFQDGPGILDDYRQGNWGVERVCLDGIQNHLPSDSKGTACFLSFLVDDEWVDVSTAKLTPEKIKKVRFADNGVGFTTDNLLYLHSTKSSEAQSVGQFGEGMKLASMASVNLGLGMELQSRNWSALVTGKSKKLVNTRDNDKIEEHKALTYDIRVYDGKPIVGSRTIFHTPTPEFIDFALNLPTKVLQLDPKYKPKFTTEFGDIINLQQGGQAFVKGIFVQNINSILSYNFNNANVNPDRNAMINFNGNSQIREILRKLNNIHIMKVIIARAIDYQLKMEKASEYNKPEMPIELKVIGELEYDFRYGKGVPSLWERAFREVCEEKGRDGENIEAVLKTDYEVPEQLENKLEKFNVISLPAGLSRMLQDAGVKTDREVLPEYIEEDVKTSLSLDYGKDIWGTERMVLDACQNHLPSDSGGRDIYLRFQTNDGEWHDFTEFSKYDDKDIKKIKISDDGKRI